MISMAYAWQIGPFWQDTLNIWSHPQNTTHCITDATTYSCQYAWSWTHKPTDQDRLTSCSIRGCPAKRALSAILQHGGRGPLCRIPSNCHKIHNEVMVHWISIISWLLIGQSLTMHFWLNISLDWLKNLMEIFFRGQFKYNTFLVMVHWIPTISCPLIG